MNSPDLTMATVKMVLALVAILAVFWGAYRWSRGSFSMGQGGFNKGRMIRVLANHYLGMKKSISVVEVPGAVLVLGISADRVNLLSRIDDPETIAALHLQSDPGAAPNFRDQLHRISRSLRSKQTGSDSESATG
jgi:flagellar protein FliO/FliZ